MCKSQRSLWIWSRLQWKVNKQTIGNIIKSTCFRLNFFNIKNIMHMLIHTELEIIYIVNIIWDFHVCSIFCDKQMISIFFRKRRCIINRSKLIDKICKNIRIELFYSFIECLLTYSSFKFIYWRVEMSKISIRSSSISKNKIIDDRIEIHIPVTSKILFSFTAKHVDDVRLYNRIEITKKLR